MKKMVTKTKEKKKLEETEEKRANEELRRNEKKNRKKERRDLTFTVVAAGALHHPSATGESQRADHGASRGRRAGAVERVDPGDEHADPPPPHLRTRQQLLHRLYGPPDGRERAADRAEPGFADEALLSLVLVSFDLHVSGPDATNDRRACCQRGAHVCGLRR